VVSPIAETTTTTSFPARFASAMRLATRLILSASDTDDPPYFCTTSATCCSVCRRPPSLSTARRVLSGSIDDTHAARGPATTVPPCGRPGGAGAALGGVRPGGGSGRVGHDGGRGGGGRVGVAGGRACHDDVGEADDEGAADEVAEADPGEVAREVGPRRRAEVAEQAEREGRHVGDDVLEAGGDEGEDRPEQDD